jgi:hypothetical protein
MNEPKKRKGLLVNVYRDNKGDCTMRGISSNHDLLLIVGKGIDEIFEETQEHPAVEFVPAVDRGVRAHIKPFGEKRWVQFGGNFAYCSDSRIAALNNGNPIAIFDRIEG